MALGGTFRFLCAARRGSATVRRHRRRTAGLGIGLDRQRAGCKEREQGKPRDDRLHEIAPGPKYRFGVSLALVAAADQHYRRTSCGFESRTDITTINSDPAKDYPRLRCPHSVRARIAAFPPGFAAK